MAKPRLTWLIERGLHLESQWTDTGSVAKEVMELAAHNPDNIYRIVCRIDVVTARVQGKEYQKVDSAKQLDAVLQSIYDSFKFRTVTAKDKEQG